MMLTEAKKFHAYARECLQLAEQASEPDIRKRLIELSHIWMEAALKRRGIYCMKAPPRQWQNKATRVGYGTAFIVQLLCSLDSPSRYCR
jgi:hypothetical protein